jgi:excisionase family DNA binding protein
MPIRDLADHPARYVTIAELAEYWAVSRQQIYKRIESGAIEAIQLGSRLYRVRTVAALEYERRASVGPQSQSSTQKLPRTIGVHRVLRRSGTE